MKILFISYTVVSILVILLIILLAVITVHANPPEIPGLTEKEALDMVQPLYKGKINIIGGPVNEPGIPIIGGSKQGTGSHGSLTIYPGKPLRGNLTIQNKEGDQIILYGLADRRDWPEDFKTVKIILITSHGEEYQYKLIQE